MMTANTISNTSRFVLSEQRRPDFRGLCGSDSPAGKIIDAKKGDLAN